MNHALHKEFPIPTMAYIYGPLVTASLTTIATFVLAALLFRKIQRIKASDNRRRISTVRGSHSDQYASTTELMPVQIPEDEAQRKQLLRLLQKRENNRAASLDNGNTYRIDLPPSLAGGGRGGYLSVPSGESRGRSGSQPSDYRRGFFSSLIPARARSATTENFVDARERRRSEIERSMDSTQATPQPESGMWSSTPMLQQSQYNYYQPPPWSSSRYG